MNSKYLYRSPMRKAENLTLRFFLKLILLLFFSNKLFSQPMPGQVKAGDRIVFYGPHIKKNIQYTNQVKTEASPQSKASQTTGTKQNSNRNTANKENTVNQKPAGATAVINLITVTKQPSCDDYNGSIIITASGGVAPYTYQETNGWPQNTGNFPMLREGIYNITVTDANGDIGTTTVTLTNTLSPPKIRIVSSANASSCTAADASVILEASGGMPPYQYSMDRLNFQASNIFSGFTAGEYLFFVKDANGCIASIGNLYHFVSPSCNGGYGFGYTGHACGNKGNIRASINYPNPPYTYSMDGVNYNTDGEFINLTAGIYPVYFKDALGNVRIFAISIYPLCSIIINYITVDAACKQNDGILTVTADNGAPPYTYTIDGINYQASNVFTGLAPGVYFITAKDANGVTNSLGATVYDRCPVVTVTATGETCVKNDGTITAAATKGTAPYQYSINGIDYQPGNVFTGLAKGNYAVTLKDALGFTGTANITITDECLAVAAVAINATCGNSNGQITATVVKGTAPYQYSIDGTTFQFSNVFTGVKEGTHTVTVKDINGQTGTTLITVNNIAGPQITLNTTPESCIAKDGSITVMGTGGKLPFQYSIDGNSFQVSNVFANITTGDYTVWIKDANECSVSQNINVPHSCPTVTVIGVNETCNSSNGNITASGSNGTAPYQYSIDGINFQTGKLFTGIKAGLYTITIKDALNSTNTTSISIKNICPTVSVVINDGLCGTTNGSITATGANGTAPYQYSIDGTNFKPGNTFTTLASADYTITVKDANGLINTTNAIVNNFPGPQITASSAPASCLNNDGNITITANGGTAPLQFSIAGGDFQESPAFNNLSAGDYTAVATDVNGCTSSLLITVGLNNNLTLATGNDITICEGKNGNIPATSNASVFTWSPSASLNNSSLLNPTASPVTTTKYFITATFGICTKKDSVTVLVNPAPVAKSVKDTIICFGQSVQLSGSGGSFYTWAPATYLDNPGTAEPFAIKPLQSITYNLHVTDAIGCTSLQPSPVAVTVTPPAKIFAGNDTSVVMNEPFRLTALDVNNSGFVAYSWSPSYGLNNITSEKPIAVLDKEITYKVTANTAVGCQGSDEIRIKVYRGPEIYVPKAFTPNNDGKNDVLKAIPVGIRDFKHFVVYNRWGEQVFYTSNSNIGWDGNFRNTSQDTNTFVWKVEGVDNKGAVIKKTGTVTLIR